MFQESDELGKEILTTKILPSDVILLPGVLARHRGGYGNIPVMAE